MRERWIPYVWGSVRLDQDAGSDLGDGGWDGARVSGGSKNGAKVLVVGVDETTEVTTGDGEGGITSDGGSRGTGDGGADVLVDAQGVGGEGEASDGHLGSGSAVGEGGRLGVDDRGGDKGNESGDELHGWRSLSGGFLGWKCRRGLRDEEKKKKLRHEQASFYTRRRRVQG